VDTEPMWPLRFVGRIYQDSFASMAHSGSLSTSLLVHMVVNIDIYRV
jgi:hypothetical protein